MNRSWNDFLSDELEKDHAAALIRTFPTLDDLRLIPFCDNDYLGLRNHPAVKEAAIEAIHRHGTGTGAARTISGTTPIHMALEEQLAAWKGTERALLYPTGYAAAMGTLSCILQKGDYAVLDKSCHSCLLDGAAQSPARVAFFPHNDIDELETILKTIRESDCAARIWIVVESIYSMEGDYAPLEAMAHLKNRYGACLFVDEAHATGIAGSTRSGRIGLLDLTKHVDVQMGTLGKAVGAGGGFVCAGDRAIAYLMQRSRAFLFTTSSPPPVVAAATEALRIIQSEEGQTLVDKLQHNIAQFRDRLHTAAPVDSAIQPILIGKEEEALRMANQIRLKGFFVPAIRYPTVPRGRARLRITLGANHTVEQIDQLAEAIDA